MATYITGFDAESEIKRDVSKVQAAYNQRSDTLQQSEHCLKMKRVSQTLGDVIRRTDQILSLLFEKKAVTSQEYDLVQSQSTIHKWTQSLIDVLCKKPVSGYECLLYALDTTQQQHLSQMLSGELI